MKKVYLILAVAILGVIILAFGLFNYQDNSLPLPTNEQPQLTPTQPSPTVTQTPTPLPAVETIQTPAVSENLISLIEYSESQKEVKNPFRGFYHHTETFSNNYQSLTLDELQSYQAQEKVTIILRVFYLENFVDSPISDEYLALVRQDMEVVREAGFSVVVRFAYTLNGTPPYGDAPPEIVLGHINQLGPIFQEYGDVIKVVQAGFVGSWGEWYFTDHFADPADPSAISPEDYQNRFAVVYALLQQLPADSFVLLRTPDFKLRLFPDELLNANNAYQGSDIARVGFHNDCFLASEDDYGTFQNENDRPYLASETLFSPMGGETCNPYPPRSGCATALEELALFHWSFLNIGYHPDVVNGWREEGCFNQIQNYLGYRFVLEEGSFSQQVVQGGSLDLQLELKNVGWAGIYTPTEVEFVLRHVETEQEYSFIVSDDPRNWLPSPDSYPISHSLCLPEELEVGNYQLFLRLVPSGATDKALYAIELANELSWESATGLNNLGHMLEVLPGPPPAGCLND